MHYLGFLATHFGETKSLLIYLRLVETKELIVVVYQRGPILFWVVYW